MLLFFILKTVLIDLQSHPTVPASLYLLLLLAIPFSTKCRSQFERKILSLHRAPFLPYFYISVREVVKTYLCAATQIMFLGGDFEFVLCFDKFEDYSSQRPGIGGTKDTLWKDSKKMQALIQILTSHRHVFRQHTNTDQPWSSAMI